MTAAGMKFPFQRKVNLYDVGRMVCSFKKTGARRSDQEGDKDVGK